ncbi:hypothetical protein ACFPES_33305 [Paenibacillus sp. GCM10023248]|nr:hypothetical protein [Paenibacillus sp. MAHUQ-63]
MNEDKVYLVPTSQIDKKRKIILRDLAGRNALKITLMYESKGSVPSQIILIQFTRISFDENGVYDLRKALESEESRVSFAYVNRDVNEAIARFQGTRPDPLPIPRGVADPTENEILCIESYLNSNFPELLKNSPDAIYQAIIREQLVHDRQVRMMKNSYKS